MAHGSPRIHVGVAATDPVYELAEGVIWDDGAALVRWVDIWEGRVLSGSLAGDRIVDATAVAIGQTAAAVALAEDGGLIVAAARGLAVISPEGRVTIGPDLLGDRPTKDRSSSDRPSSDGDEVDVRLNDGVVDLQGRFLTGTMSFVGKSARDLGVELLLRVSANGRVEVLREGVRLSNGIAFSPDGALVYHVDTFAGTVSSHSYGPGQFEHTEPWVTVLDDLPAPPDGLTVDAAGNLWVAQWGGSSVRCHAPTGELLDVVTVDAGQVSRAGFVGPGLDVLAITTAREGLDVVTDHTGALFLAHPGPVGMPAHRWPGSTSTPYWLLPERTEALS